MCSFEIKAIKELTKHLSYLAIEHIGSTAVTELSSKAVLDLFIVIPSIARAQDWIKPLASLAYVFWDENPDKEHLRFFKGMPPFGDKRTHHVHLVAAGDETMAQRLLFRDILRADDTIRRAYEDLKKSLAQLYPLDREAYTESKTDFIKQALTACGYSKEIKR